MIFDVVRCSPILRKDDARYVSKSRCRNMCEFQLNSKYGDFGEDQPRAFVISN